MIEFILPAAILGMCIVMAAMSHKAPHVQFMPPLPVKKILRGQRYNTLVGSDAFITATTAAGATGYIISAGFTAPLRTPCRWDADGRAITQPHAYDLREEV